MIVKIIKYNDIKLKIETDDADYISLMRAEFTRKVPNFQFTPAYRRGKWDGRVCMIEKFRSTFPYGLLFDYIRKHKKLYPKVPLEIDQEVKDLFINKKLKIKYDLPTHKVRPYQDDCIRSCLKYTKGIIRSATASGKSLVITYIIKNLLDNNLIEKAVIVVPRKGLIAQFYQDMIEYGIDSKILGMAFADRKQWDKTIVVSTWQTLKNNHDKLNTFQCIIADETHGAKAHEFMKILEKSNAEYRFGFTGTMHTSELDNWNTKAYLGPIIREYSSGFLAEKGYISKCTVNMLNIEYREDIWHGDYHTIRDNVFQNEYRLNLIKELSNSLNENVLLLVDKVKKEGELLKLFLSGSKKEVIFLSGKDSIEVREKWRKECMKRKDIILIATYGIFTLGINIPNLKYIILASPFKAKIRVLQSIGRALRLHSNKEDTGAQIFDIHDHTKFFEKYGNIRSRYYDKEGFDTVEEIFHESDDLDLNWLFKK